MMWVAAFEQGCTQTFSSELARECWVVNPVNLEGANLSNANLRSARLFGSFKNAN